MELTHKSRFCPESAGAATLDGPVPSEAHAEESPSEDPTSNESSCMTNSRVQLNLESIYLNYLGI